MQPSIIVWFANSGAGLGSCMISLSVLIELSKILNFKIAVDWSHRPQISNKNICVFNYLFKYPQNIDGVRLISGDHIYEQYTKKGKIIKPADILNIKNSGDIFVVRDACKPSLLRGYVNKINENLSFNLKQLVPNFKKDKLKLLSDIRQKKIYGSIHLRTGHNDQVKIKNNKVARNEFRYSGPHWMRASILKGSLRGILLFKLKHFLNSFDNKLSDPSNWFIFSDQLSLTNYFLKHGFSSIQDLNLPKKNNLQYFFKDTEESLSFYEQTLFELIVMSESKVIIWDGSGFAQTALLISQKTKPVLFKKAMGIFLNFDYAYLSISFVKRFFYKLIKSRK